MSVKTYKITVEEEVVEENTPVESIDTSKFVTLEQLKKELESYALLNHTHDYNTLLNLPVLNSNGNTIDNIIDSYEYTVKFEDILQESINSGRYENSNYSDYKKQCAYMKYAITLATQRINSHGGGTILFEKLYTVDGGTAGWEIDNVNNITFKGVGRAGFIKPEHNSGSTSSGYQRFGFIRHCNNIKFINMCFVGRQTDMKQLYFADYGVEIHSGDGIDFERCTFENMNDACLIVGNETVTETDGLDCTRNVHVNMCKFINCWQTSTTQNGVYNYWFTNNYVAGGATKFAQRKPNGDHIYLLNNIYDVHENYPGNPIELCNYNNVIIEGNVIHGTGNTSGGISNYYNTHADDNYYQTHKNITIKDNKIYGCKTGIYMNHGVKDYPAGRYLIEGNIFEGQTSNKCISIAGFYDNIEIKNNQFSNSQAIGISIGASSTPIINKLDIVGNTFKGLSKTTLNIIQQVNILRLIDNYMEEGGNSKLIQLGDGTNNGIIGYFELRGNYLINNQGQSILYSQGAEISIFIIKDNTIRGNNTGLNNIKSTKVILSDNYIDTTGVPLSFISGSTGTIYTNANILSKSIKLNGMTEIKM